MVVQKENPGRNLRELEADLAVRARAVFSTPLDPIADRMRELLKGASEFWVATAFVSRTPVDEILSFRDIYGLLLSFAEIFHHARDLVFPLFDLVRCTVPALPLDDPEDGLPAVRAAFVISTEDAEMFIVVLRTAEQTWERTKDHEEVARAVMGVLETQLAESEGAVDQLLPPSDED